MLSFNLLDAESSSCEGLLGLSSAVLGQHIPYRYRICIITVTVM